jgi:magnesium transporter
MNPLLLPDLREIIGNDDRAELREFFSRLLPSQAAELLDGLTPGEISWALSTLEPPEAAAVFEYLPAAEQSLVAAGAGRGELAALLDKMSPDDRAQFVQRLPPGVVEEIMPLMAQADRRDVLRLLSFDEGTAGRRMTTDYASVRPDETCADALARVRREAPDKETIYSIFVIDANRHIVGVAGLKDLLLARPDARVSDLMRSEMVSVRCDEPVALAAESIKKYDLIAIPVLDAEGRMLGILTVDDLIDVLEHEATKDILSLGAVEPGALDRPYFENKIFRVVRLRVGWLLLLFVAEMFTGSVLRHYDEALARVVALSFFIPLLIGTGGNCGSQTVSTIIRSLALGEITFADWFRVLRREASTGLMLGLILGAVGVLRSLMWSPDLQLAFTVGCTLVAICTWSNAVAALVPLAAQRAGMDPTVLSAPLITTLVDATGLVIYFSIAMAMIGRLAEPLETIPADLIARVQDLAGQAPPQLAEKLRGLVEVSGAAAHPHDWLVPLIALGILGLVLFSVSRAGKLQQRTHA